MARIVVLSDIHLSPTHGLFWENWCVARDLANTAKADAVVVNGDLTINGPDSDAEIAFAASVLNQLQGRVLALPGNHDVGDEPPGQDPNQIVDEPRLARWDNSFGTDRWTLDAGGWRLIGVNAQLFGSGLAREHAQDIWLHEQLTAAESRRIALFLHKPLFLEDPNDGVVTAACIVPSARTRLFERLHRSHVRLIVSGHLASTSRSELRRRATPVGVRCRLCCAAGARRRRPLRAHNPRFFTRRRRHRGRTTS